MTEPVRAQQVRVYSNFGMNVQDLVDWLTNMVLAQEREIANLKKQLGIR